MKETPKPPPPAAGRARAALVLLLLINLFNYVDRQVLAAVVPSIERSFFGGAKGAAHSTGLEALQEWCRGHLGFQPELAFIGVLSMAFMVTYMIGAPVFGRLAERHSRWALVGVGVISWSLASGASGLASTFLGLLLTRCLVGIGEAAYGPVAPTILSDLYDVKVRGKILAWFYMAIPVGSALGYVLGGAVAGSSLGDRSVLGIHADSWRWAFFLVVPPGVLLGLWSFFMKEPSRGASDGLAEAPPARVRLSDYGVLLRTPSWVLSTLGMTAMTFAIGGIAFWMPYYLAQRPGAPASATVIFGGITCVSGLVATLAGGVAGDRLRPRYSGSYFLVSGLAMIVGFPFLLLALDAPFPLLWIWLFIASFCLFFNTGPTNTILANVSHPSIRAASFALNILLIHAFGDVISPVVVGVLSDRYSMHLAFVVVGAMFLVAGILWLIGTRFLERDTALAATQLGGGLP